MSEVRPGRYRQSREVRVVNVWTEEIGTSDHPDVVACAGVVVPSEGSERIYKQDILAWGWERLPDPEPEWKLGHVVVDADGSQWVYAGDGVWAQYGRVYPDDKMRRPLTVTHEPKAVGDG